MNARATQPTPSQPETTHPAGAGTTPPAAPRRRGPRRSAVTLAGLLLGATAGAAHAADPATAAGGWRTTVTPYAWLTDVGMDAELRDGQTLEGEIAFEDLIEDVDLAFQLRFDAQRGAHGITLDVSPRRIASPPSLRHRNR